MTGKPPRALGTARDRLAIRLCAARIGVSVVVNEKSGQICLRGKLTAFCLTPPDQHPDGWKDIGLEPSANPVSVFGWTESSFNFIPTGRRDPGQILLARAQHLSRIGGTRCRECFSRRRVLPVREALSSDRQIQASRVISLLATTSAVAASVATA